MDISVVLACYREETHLEESFCELLRALDGLDLAYEIIFIDDASPDGTRAIIDKIITAHPDVAFQKIFHETNLGRGGTVTEGFRSARGEVVGFLDIDLEISPHCIGEFVSAIRDGSHDGAVAYRTYGRSLNPRKLLRIVLSWGYRKLIQWTFDMSWSDTEAGFKFFRRDKILPVLNRVEDTGWFWDTEIMYRAHEAGLSVKEIPCVFTRRADKASTVRLFADSVEYYRNLRAFKKRLKAEAAQRMKELNA